MNSFKPSSNYYEKTFKPLLKIGLEFEKQAQELIIKHFNYKYSLKSICDNNAYDFELTNGIKYEVKGDIKATLTNNIYIEYLQFDKPSGISTTEAHYYIIIVPNKCNLLIDVIKLKHLIETKQYFKVFYPNQYNNFTCGYLFKLDKLIEHSTLI